MATFEAGGLVFEVDYVTLGDDGGPTLRVFGDVDEERVQILRFDCFRDAPHYHYDPTRKNEVHQLQAGDDNIQWTTDQVRTRLKEMITTAGYTGLAQSTDYEAVQTTVDLVEQALRASDS